MILTPGSTSCSKPFSLSRTRSSAWMTKGSAAGYKHGTAEILTMLGIIDSAEIHPDCPDLRPGDEQARMREALIRPMRMADSHGNSFLLFPVMSVDPTNRFSRLCVHTITTKGWELEEAVGRYAEAGVSGITVWSNGWKAGTQSKRVIASDPPDYKSYPCAGAGFIRLSRKRPARKRSKTTSGPSRMPPLWALPSWFWFAGRSRTIPRRIAQANHRWNRRYLAPRRITRGEVGHRTPPPHVCGRPFRDQLIGLGQ